MKKENKVKNWVKEHKWELIGAAALVAGAFGVGYFLRRDTTAKVDVIDILESMPKSEHLKVADWAVGKLDDVMKYDNGAYELWMNEVPIDAMGELGKELLNNCNVPEDWTAWVLMEVHPNK